MTRTPPAGSNSTPADTRARGFFPTLRTFEPLVVFQVYLLLMVFSPSIYVIEPLGAAGTPSTILGCLLLGLWAIGRATNVRSPLSLTPVHWLVGIFVIAMLIGFSVGMLRPTSSGEFSSSLRGLIALSSGVGVTLFAVDTMVTRDQIAAFVNSAVAAGTALAVMGLVQFATGFDFVAVLHLPGLIANSDIGGLYERSGFSRVSATAIHSIEFSFVAGAILPLAGQIAINASRRDWWKWLPFVLMLGALPLTVARSGAVALVIGIVFATMLSKGRQRIFIITAVALSAVAFRSALPGLLGTIRSLFTGASEDNSITGRVEDLKAVGDFVTQAPWFGRGLATFVPDIYRTLDNQFLATAIETGLVGAVALLALFVGAIGSAAIAAARAANRFDTTQALAIATGLFTTLVLSLTFDSFAFPMAFGTLSLMLGVSGAVWRLHQADTRSAKARKRMLPPLSPRRRAWVGVAVVAILAIGALSIQSARPSYEATGSIVLLGPPDGGNNLRDVKIDIPGVSDLMSTIMGSAEMRELLADDAVDDYAVGVGDGSLGPLTDRIGSGERMRIAARSSTEADALRDATRVREELGKQLAEIQYNRGIPSVLKVRLDGTLANIEVYQQPVHTTVGAAGLLGVAAMSALLLVAAGRRLPRRGTRAASNSRGGSSQRPRPQNSPHGKQKPRPRNSPPGAQRSRPRNSPPGSQRR